jgi:hypothetical protein
MGNQRRRVAPLPCTSNTFGPFPPLSNAIRVPSAEWVGGTWFIGNPEMSG